VLRDYGGWRSLLSSGYFRLSLLIAAGFWPLYGSGKWAEFTVGIIPVVLGLTLAGAAILTTIGGDAFRERLAQVQGTGGQEAPILELLSNFIFAMMVQLCALVFALLFQAKPFEASWLEVVDVDTAAAGWVNFVAGAFGSLLLIYGILLILGAAFTVRSLATVYVLDARAEQSLEDANGGHELAPTEQDRRGVSVRHLESTDGRTH
jgi:hypothetical protein